MKTEVTHIEDMILIKYAANPILIHSVQPPSNSSFAYIEGPSTLISSIEIPNVTIDTKMGEYKAELVTIIGREEVISTSPPTSAFTLEPAWVSTFPYHSTTTGIVGVPHKLL